MGSRYGAMRGENKRGMEVFRRAHEIKVVKNLLDYSQLRVDWSCEVAVWASGALSVQDQVVIKCK